MKRILSLFLAAVVLFCNFCAFSIASVYASTELMPEKVENLRITTTGKKNLLKLTWDQQAGVDGFQIFRSTTGKSRTYELTASVRNKNTYVDKNLKNSTAYYYKIRAFSKQNRQTVFGPFAKVDLSTRMTAAYAAKRFNQAYKALSQLTTVPFHSDDHIYRKNMYGYEDLFSSMTNSKYSSKADVQKYLEKYFTKKLAKIITNHFFREENGRLYLWTPEAGMLGETNYNKTTAKIIKETDNSVAVKVTRVHEFEDMDLLDIESYVYSTALSYNSGKWVFSRGSIWTNEALYV